MYAIRSYYDIVDMLQPDRQPDVIVAHSRRKPLLPGELLVRRRRRVDHETLGVPDVGQVGEELHIVDELLSRLHPSLDPEPQDRAVQPAVVILLRQSVLRMVGEPRVIDPRHVGVRQQELRHRQRVRAVPLHSQGKGLYPLEEEEGVERGHRRTQIPQELHARLEDERDVAQAGEVPEDLPDLESVVGRITSYNVCYTKLLRLNMMKTENERNGQGPNP